MFYDLRLLSMLIRTLAICFIFTAINRKRSKLKYGYSQWPRNFIYWRVSQILLFIIYYYLLHSWYPFNDDLLYVSQPQIPNHKKKQWLKSVRVNTWNLYVFQIRICKHLAVTVSYIDFWAGALQGQHDPKTHQTKQKLIEQRFREVFQST